MGNKKTGSRIGKAVLWGTGLAAVPGIAKTIASPVKDLASDTKDAIRSKTPTIQEAKAAWNAEIAEDPSEYFVAYAKKFHLSDENILALEKQYQLLFTVSVLLILGGLVLLYWNLSGMLLAAAGIVASLGTLYRRDALHYRKLTTFRNWMKERFWWIFG